MSDQGNCNARCYADHQGVPHEEWMQTPEERAQEALAATGAVQPYPAVAPAVPVARVRALVALLYPEEMTPTAKRMIEQVCEAHE